jgi:anti-sigma B factor antagonist
LEYLIETIQDIAVVRIHDDRATVADGVDDLKAAMMDLISGGQIRVVIDLGRVAFADSSMLGVLVSALKLAARKRGDIRLFNMQPAVRALFDLTRLHRVFESFDSEEEALASF